jgi:G3E family GTPase
MSDVIVLIFLLSRQVAMSDVIIINKTDLVTEEELHKLKSRVR